jgi:tripartite-type tricarboxylate transporter receptor subunit TctC
MTINPSLQPSAAFDPARDLAPIARVLVMPSILAVNNEVPAKSVAELFALAKAQPGKLSFASPGVGTPQHIAGELLKSLAGVDIVHVPYRGAVFTDVIGGRVTMTLQNMGAILPVVRDGKLRGLAVTSLKRSPIISELPSRGSGCWRQPARRLPSSARCTQTSRRSRRKPTCASAWRNSVLRRPSICRRNLLW